MLLTITPVLAAFLTFLVAAIVGCLVGYLVFKTVALAGKFGAAMVGLLVALILGLLIWLIIVSSVTFSVTPATNAFSPFVPAPALAGPASAAQPLGSCSAAPVNPVDGEYVSLTTGDYVIEEFDNSLPVPKHTFWAYDVAAQGSITVMATAEKGTRAWSCTDYTAAYETAMKSAVGYKSHNAAHAVFGPDAVEVR